MHKLKKKKCIKNVKIFLENFLLKTNTYITDILLFNFYFGKFYIIAIKLFVIILPYIQNISLTL